jgi:glyoxylase-like metal-dependent hydrolase (beta-lactamase superfamily II)
VSGTWHVDLLHLGGWDWAPGFEMFWMEANAPDEPLALVGLVLRDGESTVLVNTGPDVEMLSTLNERWAEFDPRHQVRVSAEQRLEAQLGRLDIDVTDVTHVIVTPFQPYAIGNLLALPNATYCLSRIGWIDFHAPRWRNHPHEYRPFVMPPAIRTALVTDKWDQVHLLDDEEELLPGLSVFWVGSHHRSSVAVKVTTDEGVVIASDCFMRRENVTENRPLGINESLVETLTAYERIRREADTLVPLYDPGVFQQHPKGIGAPLSGQRGGRADAPPAG